MASVTKTGKALVLHGTMTGGIGAEITTHSRC